MLSEMLKLVNPQDSTIVQYDRSARKWQAINGRTLSFPAGKDGKSAARRARLHHDYPQLYDKITELIFDSTDSRLLGRLLDAADLLIDGHVSESGYVASQSTDGLLYQTKFEWGGYRCNCDSWHYSPVDLPGYGDCCKHGLAQHLAYLLDIELPAAPVPFDGRPAHVI